ncbi:MAG: hypothetical protein IPH03_00350 [Tetrasphaera sp.]|nr:hypothetical protein [Tetrasphaera sp.]
MSARRITLPTDSWLGAAITLIALGLLAWILFHDSGSAGMLTNLADGPARPPASYWWGG